MNDTNGNNQATTPPKLTLSTDPVPSRVELINYSILFVGPPGIGKSTLVASAYPEEQIYYADCDDSESLLAYSLPKTRCTTWQEYADVVRAFVDDDRFQWFCPDTLNGAYDLCSKQICLEKNITSPSDLNDYGSTWNQISERFMRPLKLIESKGKGILATAHATITEVFINGKRY